MSFVDLIFYPAVFLLVLAVVLIQHIFRGKPVSNTYSKAVLLLFSYVVILLYDWRFCLCITAVILIAWRAAALIEAAEEGTRKKMLTTGAVVIFCLILGVFKYFNFFMSGVTGLLGCSWTTVNIILPVGISFYIFTAVGYVLDVSWGSIPAEKSFLDIALLLAFFPKLVCGPIVSAGDFLPQLKEDRRVTLRNLETGVQIFVFGLFKKVVLADHLAVFVDDVFASVSAYGSLTIWLAVFSNLLQVYFDFSGYSDMAVGISRIFGYEIRRNFNLPFIAENISDFWDRWHISLSSWLNEYVFNPIALRFKRRMAQLPGDKRKKYRMLPNYGALLLTFLVSGLWHGAGLTFIVWGLCHGVYSVFHAMYVDRRKKRKGTADHKSRTAAVVHVLANYFVVNIIQVFFRAESLAQALYIYKRMVVISVGVEQPYVWAFFAYLMLAAATFAAVRHCAKYALSKVEGYYPIEDLGTVRGLFWFFLVCGFTISLAYIGESYFIYGQF